MLVPAIMTVMNGKAFKINIMHIFHLQYGQNDIPLNHFSEKTLDKLLDVMNQRPALRNYRVSSTSKITRKIKKKEPGTRIWKELK